MKKLKLLFKVAITMQIIFALFSCKENPTDNYDPPNINDPWDFRLTDFYPTWSPDGEEIAYIHGDTLEAMTGIYIIDTNRTNKRLLISSPGAYSPDWSPDGKWIVFSMYAQIYKIQSTGDSLTQLTFEGRNFYPSWSPDGEWIAFDSNKDSPNGMNFIWKMKSDGTQKIRVSYEPDSGEIRMPFWTYDSKKIIHIRYLVGVFSSEVFIMDNNGFYNYRLTHNSSTDSFPKNSKDGSQIAFTSQPEGGKPQIWVMNSNGTDQRQLTTTQGYSCDWSPDGQWIVYTDSRAVNGRLWIMRKDGRDKRQLTFNNAVN